MISAKSFTSQDLLSWSYQIARGMSYLSSKKVLHGDLAARNVLLCDDNVVKICDFGLARSLYKSELYQKEGKAKLPYKWLALESISEFVFSVYSDVWSFGKLLGIDHEEHSITLIFFCTRNLALGAFLTG